MAALRDEVCVFQPVWTPACWTLQAVGAASGPESWLCTGDKLMQVTQVPNVLE